MAGSIRTTDDPTALDVKISIWDTEVTMRADGAELGHWPAAAVTINPIDSFTFEFAAEGDHLIFTPNNPDEFREHPMVAGSSKSKRKRRDKKAAKSNAPAAPALRWDEDSKAETDLRSKRPKSKEPMEPRQSRKERKAAASQAKRSAATSAARQARAVAHDPPDVPKPSRRERKAASRPEPVVQSKAVIDEVDTPPVKSSTKQRKPARASKPPRERKPPKERKSLKERMPQRESKPKVETNGHSRFAELRHRAWISSLDFARQYDLFGLDRVPVHLEHRDDPNHAHTWDHRVAPASGPGTFICTICGAIKKRSG